MSKFMNQISIFLRNMDSTQWLIAAVVMTVFGVLCMRGLDSKRGQF